MFAEMANIGSVRNGEQNIVDTVTAPAEQVASEAPADSEPLLEVRLTAINFAARDTNIYQFRRHDGARLPSYDPGAHLDLHLPNGLVRQYSLLAPEREPEKYLIGVKRDAASRGGSRCVHEDLHVGMSLKISAPRNNFPLVENAEQVIFFAGGIGITPIWCMIQRMQALGRPWRLHYSCRSRQDMAFREELAAMEQAHLHFDDENQGRVLDLATIIGAAAKSAHLYCCGPQPMITAFEAATASWPREQIHVEYFTPKQEPARTGGFVVELARSGQEFFIPPGQSILQVLYEAGIDVDYSCELGICGACETGVISGIPEHRDSVLSEEDQASNTKVMICCAGCKTDRLVLDL
jgi:tetrachlorobenzoquinone reductase